jgi:hypothetical protein
LNLARKRFHNPCGEFSTDRAIRSQSFEDALRDVGGFW